MHGSRLSHAITSVQLQHRCKCDSGACAAGCIPNPKSFATVSLGSTDPFATPVVNTNLFGSPGEAETMVQCLEKEREVLAQMPANFNMSELPLSLIHI